MPCKPEDIVSRLERMMSSRFWSRWLEDTMKAFAAALTGVAENRATDVVAALFLAEVGGTVYAGARLAGRSPEEALREALDSLCAVYEAARRILEEGFRSGKLENQYREALKSLGGSRTQESSGQNG